MRLRGIDFGHVLDASGARAFFGEGYPYHRLLRPIGLNFRGSTFVAKTTTVAPRVGNMPLRDDLAPRERLPRCIVVKWWKGIALNAVGLSGPGAAALLADGRWQRRSEPFFLSFMSVATTASERHAELSGFVDLLTTHLPQFRAPIGLQLNFSCPNVSVANAGVIDEIRAALDVAATLGIPLMPKLSVVMPLDVALAVAQHPSCDALCVSNTVPWGALTHRIDWKKLFGSDISPLAEFGGGGLSGRPLLPLVFDWLMNAREAGLTVPVNAGGGVLSPLDAHMLFAAGASSIFLGSIAMLRPWRMQKTIHLAKTVGAKTEAIRVRRRE